MGARSAHDCQPLTIDGTSWIVADARIDDRATLLGALPPVTSQSDATSGNYTTLAVAGFIGFLYGATRRH